MENELLLKVFHAKIANDVKDYKDPRCPRTILPMLAFAQH
jgi:hypothetical protein